MKIYKIAENTEKVVKWECPVTGIYIVAIFENGEPINGYEIYESDGSFVHNLENFFHASNWAKKHLDKRCRISDAGKRIASSKEQLQKTGCIKNLTEIK